LTHLPFEAINDAALGGGRLLLERLILGGKFRGLEYVVRNPRRNDDRPGSFKINYRTGAWADFATGDKGGDLISLVAYLRGIEQGDAARELADIVGYSWSRTKGFANGANGSGHCNPSRPVIKVAELTAPSYPPRTPRSADGKPKFFVGGDDGPRVAPDELRRHVYRRAGAPVRIKLKLRSGRFANWYRVTDVDGAPGWQAEKPQGYIDVPFIGTINPFDPELLNDVSFWPEGEKDVERLGLAGVPAFTFGGVGDGLPEVAVEYVARRHVVILADNDDAGRRHAQAKAALAAGVAGSVRVLELPGLPMKGDVSEWLAQGHTADELTAVAEATPQWEPLSAHAGPVGSSWKAKVISASDLRRKVFEPVPYVLPGFVPEGVTILASKPKVGKSWLTLDLCLAVAAGGFTMGALKPASGDVLYLALEESHRRLQRRLDKLLPVISERWPERLTLATEWRKTNEGGISDIEDWCKSVATPRLVVIDTLEKVRPPQIAKGQSYSADYEALTGLQRLAHQYGIAIIVIHHQRKMDADDPFDTISGTLGLTGAADTILVIRKQAGAATLYARGRDIEEGEFAIQFEKTTCKWVFLGAASEVHRSNERARVVAALKEAGAPMTPKEIQLAADLRNRNATDVLLSKMTRDGEVERAKRGYYSLKPSDAGQIGQKERLNGQAADNIKENRNLSDLSASLIKLSDNGRDDLTPGAVQ
jgi:hypothetical protein